MWISYIGHKVMEHMLISLIKDWILESVLERKWSSHSTLMFLDLRDYNIVWVINWILYWIGVDLWTRTKRWKSNP